MNTLFGSGHAEEGLQGFKGSLLSFVGDGHGFAAIIVDLHSLGVRAVWMPWVIFFARQPKPDEAQGTGFPQTMC